MVQDMDMVMAPERINRAMKLLLLFLIKYVTTNGNTAQFLQLVLLIYVRNVAHIGHTLLMNPI